FCQRFGGSINSLNPAVRIDPELFVDLAAEQFVNGNSQLLSDDVVERDVNRADGRHDNAAHAVVIEVAVHPVPKLLDVPGTLADNGIAQIANGCGDGLHAREVCSLTPSHNSLSRLYANKQPGGIPAHAGKQMRFNLYDLQGIGVGIS